MSDINSYKEALTYLAQSNSDELFLNEGSNHAIEVLKNIFEYAKENVVMFAGNNRGNVTNNQEYSTAIEKFLEKGGNLRLILEKKIDLEDVKFKAYQTVYKYTQSAPDRVQVKFASKEFLNKIEKQGDGNIFHFAVGDRKSFRLEVSPDNYKAICSFNHKYALGLADLFDGEFEKLKLN